MNYYVEHSSGCANGDPVVDTYVAIEQKTICAA